MKLSKYAKELGVDYRTAWNWFKSGKIEVINESKEKDEDLVKDLISIIHCFSARIYGLRRSQRLKSKIKQVIEDTNNEMK